MRTLKWSGRLPVLLVLLLALGVLAAACGDDDADDAPTAADAPQAEQQQAADAAAADDHADDQTVSAAAGAANGALSIQHHWQALAAIQASDVADATHHVEHILGLVEGEHATVMNAVLDQLRAGELKEAEHAIEDMLAGTAEPNLTGEALHLQMALGALTAGNVDSAVHHVEHFEATAAADLAHDAEGIVAALEAGEAGEAGAQIETLLRGLTAELPAVSHDDEHEHAEGETHDDDEAGAVDRTITVVMTEFAFEPAEITATVGETVRLVLVNEGGVLHDITADTFHGDAQAAGSAEHEDSVAHGHDEQGSAFHAAAEAGHEATLVFTATEAGRFDLFCSVPGHRELGMTATLTVTE